uniref:Rho/rac guanine nucleotide exchange factor (GEF) 18b n=1 Tax=Neolamprologus brichardi TaxID=32507 RepID=A0A3Q4HAV1_NEOBR
SVSRAQMCCSQIPLTQYQCNYGVHRCHLGIFIIYKILHMLRSHHAIFRSPFQNNYNQQSRAALTPLLLSSDAHYAAVRADLESDAQDLEADSWSLAVDQQYLKKHTKETAKRQDVIYELMQTEMHHVRTLKIMLRVYVRELKENLQMDAGRLDCLFPRLENLLDLHTNFLSRLKERRRESLVPPSDRNYTINKLADVLIAQFSGEIGEKMKDSYGDFCSHHPEAVSYYKDQLQNNKKFQNIIRVRYRISCITLKREVAHEEKAMFLICASSNEPEMYEIHTASKEERNSWMTQIRQAAESCPHTEERLFSEEEEARASRFKEFRERLSQRDAAITQALTEKLQLFADMAESVAGLEDAASRSRLLLRGDFSDLQQGEVLLKGAITEVENLQNLLQSGVREGPPAPPRWEEGSGSGVLPRRADTFGGYDSNGSVKKNFSGESRSRDRSQRASSDPQLKDLCDSLEQSAIVSQQDSQIELQRASLTERASLPGRHKGNVLLEQEKQRTLALQREELASLHKLQSQHRQEQQRWEKERERHRQQVEATEARLRQREEECRRTEEQLAKEKEELDMQRETYQQDLERLRESTRAVEKEKERLEHQKKIKRKTIEVAPLSGSLNGDLLMSSGSTDLPPKPLVRGSMSVAQADYPERPEVIVRRETGSSTLPLKTEVPLHLFSTTNQLHKPVGVQQQIPTKLAAINSSKGKGSKSGKASHRTDSTASLDMKQVLPLKLSTKEDNAHKVKRSVSPHQQVPILAPPQSHSQHHHADQPTSLDNAGPDMQSASHPPNVQKPPMPPAQSHPQPSVQPPIVPPHSQSTGALQFHSPAQPQSLNPSAQVQGLSLPPPYKFTTEDLNKEDVIFF